jgi:hypothetical protein
MVRANRESETDSWRLNLDKSLELRIEEVGTTYSPSVEKVDTILDEEEDRRTDEDK